MTPPRFLAAITTPLAADGSVAGELAAAGFAGMKDSTGDHARHEAITDATRDRAFELYSGSEPLVLRAPFA